jgi:hypothetical protein
VAFGNSRKVGASKLSFLAAIVSPHQLGVQA